MSLRSAPVGLTYLGPSRATEPVAQCFACKVEGALCGGATFFELMQAGDGGDSGEAGGVAPRLEAVPFEEERGRGRFKCGSCGAMWTSNRACRGLGQYCQADGCGAAELNFPHKIRKPILCSRGGYAGAAARARMQQQVRENAVEDATQPGFGAEHEPLRAAADGSFGGACGFGGGGIGGGGQGGGGQGGYCRTSLEEAAEYGMAPPPLSGPTSTAVSVPRRKHWCTGCATGACRRPPPKSDPHDSSGSTVTIAAKTWTTNASDAWSDGSID